MVSGDFRKSKLRPSTKFEVRRPSRSEDTAHLVCQLSIYNSFSVIRNTISKNRHFYVPRPLFFVCPGDAPVAIRQTLHEWKDNSMLAKPLAACIHLSSSFPVIWTASAKNRRFHVPQPTFLFPLETPLRLSRSMLHGWKDNLMLAKPLAACTYLSSIVSELYDDDITSRGKNVITRLTFCHPIRGTKCAAYRRRCHILIELQLHWVTPSRHHVGVEAHEARLLSSSSSSRSRRGP